MKPSAVAIVGRKGGVGKTTLALGLAAHYARKGCRVVVLDLDPQGSATLALGADPSGADLAAALSGERPPVLLDVAEGLRLLAGGPELEALTNPRPLADLLAQVAADLVLMDCPPGNAALDRLAMEAAGVVLAACEPHRMAIAGAARALDEARARRPAPRCAVVLGRLDERRGLDRTAPDLLAGAFGLPVLTVRQDSALALALNAGSLPPATGRAADDLAQVAAWMDRNTAKGNA